ncbi:protein [Lentinula edodes]|uniref:Protein n=1 Tax=Lentinula edodes TaxID=5353 RepID=A0A1Q3EPA5_LENED|nr:protein [Lentinula edodes]
MSTPLPKRDERSAPKFDPKNEALLPNFFEEFERTAKAAGIDEDSDRMKRTVLGYLDAKTMKFWQSLDTFDDDAKTWEEFKTEILDYYPGATGTAEVTTEELVRVVETFQKKTISTTQELAEYHREFAVVAKALRTQGTLSEILIAQHYVRPFPENIRTRIDTGLYVHYPTKKVGQAYTINEIRKVITFLLSDASAPVSSGSFRSGDQTAIPRSTTKDTTGVKTEPKGSEDSLTQQVAALTQLMQQFVRDNKDRESGTREPRSDRGCPWDGCTSKVLKDCPDLADWVAKGKVERNERGFIQLKGGQDLPNETKYRRGLVRTRFERYFEDNPSAKTWILDVQQPLNTPISPSLAGIEVSQHNAYTLNSYQGPSMLATAATYALQGEGDPSEAAAVRDLIFKMETRRATKDRTVASNSSTSPLKSNAAPNGIDKNPTTKLPSDPDPSKPIPPRTTVPTKPPKPIIGKLPENYVPPQERTVGVQPRDDQRNYRYRAPIETEAAVERVIQTGMSSMVSVRQDDLLAIAPEYRKKVKDSITSWRIGVDGGLLDEAMVLEDVLMLDLDLANGMYSVPVTPESLKNFFTDFGDAKEGDGFYVARESHSIRAVNAMIGGRPAHCILDGGCSIVVMSDSACNAFGLAFDPEKRINLQSANGNTDWSLGLAKDVPFRFGDVVAFLQVQVVDSPAYDFILGRPFEILMQASYKNFLSGDQHLTLSDPNTHKTTTIPTVPREPPRFRKEDSREYRV